MNPNPPLEPVFAGTPVLVAYLFGSRAEGRAHGRSDVDVAVLFPRELPKEERWRWQLELIGRLTDAYRTDDVDLVILNDAPPLLRYEVIRRRRVLYNRDDEARVAFEVRAMQEWFDWAPRYKRLLGERMRQFAAGSVRIGP
ncbi:MAG TPA: nucleotidyltransferase domain-containing protein [Roseiflexaceae bacterium]|nr:nucleotidyltransferase domain-containing protein [Roseiflexaceae bacterium]